MIRSLFFLVATTLHTPEYIEAIKPRTNTWLMTPSVRVCLESGVKPFRINQAISYWRKLGYQFDDIRIDPSPTCGTPMFGEIIITLPDNTFSFGDNLASTRITISNKTKEIVKAKIFIFPKTANKERVLEHELGHALGWSHVNQSYHIMNPNWHTGGHNSNGLRLKLFYKKYID